MTAQLHTVLLADRPAQPWRNAGGATRELLAWPDLAAWDMRVSVAEITRDGPFSSFTGIERWFAVVHGAGVRLQLRGQAHVMRAGSPPLRFDGAQAPACVLLDGATQDLNLMLRRVAGSGRMQAAQVALDWVDPAPLRALFSSGPAVLQAQGQAARLPAAGLLWSAQAAHQTWRITGLATGARAWWLCFEPGA